MILLKLNEEGNYQYERLRVITNMTTVPDSLVQIAIMNQSNSIMNQSNPIIKSLVVTIDEKINIVHQIPNSNGKNIYVIYQEEIITEIITVLPVFVQFMDLDNFVK